MARFIELSIEQKSVQRLAKAMRAEVDGKDIRKDLLRELKEGVKPVSTDIKGTLKGMRGSAGAGKPAMGTVLARGTKTQVRLSGSQTGIRIKIPAGSLARFPQAQKYLDNGSWRHRVFKTSRWVSQISQIPGFWGRAFRGGRESASKAVSEALQKCAERIIARVG